MGALGAAGQRLQAGFQPLRLHKMGQGSVAPAKAQPCWHSLDQHPCQRLYPMGLEGRGKLPDLIPWGQRNHHQAVCHLLQDRGDLLSAKIAPVFLGLMDLQSPAQAPGMLWQDSRFCSRRRRRQSPKLPERHG